ncbi:MAG TPA: hypothetical protein PK082_06885 [Phycisphaerae bacterium]|nr:hypothetical protein [Phycisphaerae bacterium]
MKRAVIVLAIVLLGVGAGCERKEQPEQPKTFDRNVDAPPSDLLSQPPDVGVTEDQRVIAGEFQKILGQGTAAAATEPASAEGGPTTEPATATAPADTTIFEHDATTATATAPAAEPAAMPAPTIDLPAPPAP